MPQDDLLRQKLARLARTDEVFIDGARVIAETTGDTAIQAILDEIDDTVLMAQLTFTKGASFVTLSVSGRRVISCLAVSDDLAAQAPDLGAPLERENTALLAQTGALVGALVTPSGPLTLRSVLASSDEVPAEGGMSVPQLMSVWLTDVALPDGSPLEQLLLMGADHLEAHVLLSDGALVQTDGDPSVVASLQEAQQSRLDALRGLLEAQSDVYADRFLICFDDVLGIDMGLGLARFGGQIALFAYHNESRAVICSIWNRIGQTP